jgi:hypothetical protein
MRPRRAPFPRTPASSIKVTTVELKDIHIPDSMKRAIANGKPTSP